MGIFGYVFAGLGPRLRIAAIWLYWDYANNDGRAANERIYGKEYADHIDSHYQQAKKNYWIAGLRGQALAHGYHGRPQSGQLARYR